MRLGGLLLAWALGDAGSISVGAVCSGDEGEVCSGEEDVCGKGESEGCLQPDGIEDEGMSGRHESAEGWSPPDCCGEGKGSGGKTAAGHSLSVGRCRVANSVSLDMSGRSGVFWGEQSLIPPFHERSSVALGMGRVERHSRYCVFQAWIFLAAHKSINGTYDLDECVELIFQPCPTLHSLHQDCTCSGCLCSIH